jgi:uroporphyrinogen decarboxylase
MDNLMVEMAIDDEKATWLLDKITDFACHRIRKFTEAGADIIGLGDDIGMQDTVMMAPEMYRKWLKPRLQKVINTAKEINPEIIIFYHSCGYVTPMIDDLIEAGVDVLNPVQPECMNVEEIITGFGDRLSFNGTIGTQQIMPFGTPEEIREQVHYNLRVAGEKGGLFCCPTHMLEPEVPWQNIEAYVDAVKSFKL